MGPKNHDTKRNNLEKKCQEPYYFTHMWDIKVKATNKTKKQKKTHRQRQQYGSYQWEWVLGGMVR